MYSEGMLSSCALRFVKLGEESALMKEAAQVREYPQLAGTSSRQCLQAVESRGEGGGGRTVWVEAANLEVEEGCVYVMEDFDSNHYKTLIGKGR